MIELPTKTTEKEEIQTRDEIPLATLDFKSAPNPFSHSTEISFDLEEEAQVSLAIYNTLGSQVALLLNEPRLRGQQRVIFRAEDLAPGIYYASLQINGFVETIKLMINPQR